MCLQSGFHPGPDWEAYSAPTDPSWFSEGRFEEERNGEGREGERSVPPLLFLQLNYWIYGVLHV